MDPAAYCSKFTWHGLIWLSIVFFEVPQQDGMLFPFREIQRHRLSSVTPFLPVPETPTWNGHDTYQYMP